MKIHKIEKLKNNKYKIYFENENIITFDNVIIENNLLYKKNIDDDMYNKILIDTDYYNIYNKVVKNILKKRRSEQEIKIYLLKFDLSSDKIEKMITKLKYINLLNDEEYCKAYINDKLYISKVGINKIKSDLINKGIETQIIEKYLRKIDCNILNDRLEKMIIKKINNNKKYSNLYLKNKVLNEMINLGFEKNIILEIINKYLKDDNDIMEKEFNKVYTKLCQKYSGNELTRKIEQKMISKGFETNKIKGLLKLKQGKY